MAEIHILDNSTIDKIAAGEVVERPASVVKELVENAMDAGAKAVTVEIKEGGIEFIRVTDDGAGIEKEQVRNAFLRHATSKIDTAADLMSLHSMGFRGEALSSIAAVAKIEIITKTKNSMIGTRYALEGAEETAFEEVGAPDGTTFIVRNLFFNTPVRRKFLKTAMTEGSYITDLLEHMALSRPEISFKYVMNGQTKFFTNGDGDLRAVIYRIFGREITNEMMEFQVTEKDITLSGYLGKPMLNRANRNYENYFVNNRYIKSKIIAKAIEEGYQSYMMQHRYPFCVIHIIVPTENVDVNVHPTKMEVRFSNQNSLYKLIADNISDFLAQQEMIPKATIGREEKLSKVDKTAPKQQPPEPFEKQRRQEASTDLPSNAFTPNMSVSNRLVPNILMEDIHYGTNNNNVYKTLSNQATKNDTSAIYPSENKNNKNNISDKSAQALYPPINTAKATGTVIENKNMEGSAAEGFFEDNRINNTAQSHIVQNHSEHNNVASPSVQNMVTETRQINFFDEKLLTRQAKQEYRIVGQVFDTYWIVEYRDKMLMIDQHAAHEKVKYEHILKKVETNEVYTQVLTPPVIINVTPKEADLIQNYQNYFEELGFQIEDFGINAYAIRGVPYDLFSFHIKDLFEEILTQMLESPIKGLPQIIREKIASMACKAAVKGNNSLTLKEADMLIEQLLELDNPYNCPHGRPTIIAMTKYEIEKKFKRIV